MALAQPESADGVCLDSGLPAEIDAQVKPLLEALGQATGQALACAPATADPARSAATASPPPDQTQQLGVLVALLSLLNDGYSTSAGYTTSATAAPPPTANGPPWVTIVAAPPAQLSVTCDGVTHSVSLELQ